MHNNVLMCETAHLEKKMSILNLSLAQDIVQRTMKIIPFNVNVMDERGTIIASGDSMRVGELHSGALLALAKETSIEINSETEKQMHGAKSGVNLPLRINGVVCGVIGISGEPKEVLHYGELLKLSAEIILEHAHLINDLQRSTRYKEAFLLKLIGDAALNIEAQTWGQRLGFDFKRTHQVFLLRVEQVASEASLKQMQNTQAKLNEYEHLLTAMTMPNELVILDSYSVSSPNEKHEVTAKKRLDKIKSILDKSQLQDYVLATGLIQTGQDGIRQSHQSAKITLEQGLSQVPNRTIHNYYDLLLPVLLSGLKESWQANQLGLPLVILKNQDKANQVLEQTIRTWFANNENLQETANELGIHRNSLDYRIKRTESITGLSLSNSQEKFLLYLALVLEPGKIKK